ncbi:MAG: AbrB/MazE/SpoVT family DNA-binding domain-containing protein [Firmicutes bacterium]|nr:AbrB/MazE/SpoVT family DNA-binding domain-containing protein [Bacillota bacterium]
MKSTGIVRRIDELGRVVIPKEIRRTMKIREGEELEVFTAEDNSLVLRKYSQLEGIENIAKEYVTAVYRTTGYTAVICDTDKILAVSGDIKQFKKGDALSYKAEKLLNERKTRLISGSEMFSFFSEDAGEISGVAVSPIIKSGDVMGALMVFSAGEIGETAVKSVQTGANFLANI